MQGNEEQGVDMGVVPGVAIRLAEGTWMRLGDDSVERFREQMASARAGFVPLRPVRVLMAAAGLVRSSRRGHRIETIVLAPSLTPAGDVMRLVVTRSLGAFSSPRPLQSSLDLPRAYADYIDSPDRGTVRSVYRRVTESGLDLVEPLDLERRRAMTAESGLARLIAEDPRALRRSLALPETVVIAAVDSTGHALASTVAVCDGAAAAVLHLAGDVSEDGVGDAVWLVHCGLVARLIDAGVRRLVAPGPLEASSLWQSVGRSLGYHVAIVRVAPSS